MKVNLPQISWHAQDPILSIDWQPGTNRIATGGSDTSVRIWHVTPADGAPKVEFLSQLDRHTKPVNCVRFSPSGEYLATAGDDAVIVIWKLNENASSAGNLTETENKETWHSVKTLRGHLSDIWDLSWSLDSRYLTSASVDNKILLFDVEKEKAVENVDVHSGFVQGVSCDPHGQYLCSAASDRTCRVFQSSPNLNHKSMQEASTNGTATTTGTGTGTASAPAAGGGAETTSGSGRKSGKRSGRMLHCVRVLERLDQSSSNNSSNSSNRSAATSSEENNREDNNKKPHLFRDENLRSFVRRLCWSIDGSILVIPAGQTPNQPSETTPTTDDIMVVDTDNNNNNNSNNKQSKSAASTFTNCTWVVARGALSSPSLQLPCTNSASFCVRFNPKYFTLTPSDTPAWLALPYRMIFAVLCLDEVLVYDTQHLTPLCIVRDIHPLRLSDASWSADGRMLMVSSLDGYVTFIQFDTNELGAELSAESIPAVSSSSSSSVRSARHSAPMEKRKAVELLDSSTELPPSKKVEVEHVTVLQPRRSSSAAMTGTALQNENGNATIVNLLQPRRIQAEKIETTAAGSQTAADASSSSNPFSASSSPPPVKTVEQSPSKRRVALTHLPS